MAASMTVLSQVEIASHLSKRPDWHIEGGELVRTFKFETFPEAIAFVNKVAGIAEESNHHPDIDIRYNRVRLALVIPRRRRHHRQRLRRGSRGGQSLPNNPQAPSAGSSPGIPKCGFPGTSSTCWSFFTVFRYHQAAASPPASAVAAATTPTLSQPEG